MSAEPAVPLSVLALDLPEPPDGWAADLARRGVEVILDDLGRAAVSRSTVRILFAEHRERQEAAARRREEIERRVIAADEARRAALPPGVPVGAVPEGMTAAEMMMAADPMRAPRRRSVVEDALEHGASVIYSLNEGAS
jgi:hypothetical protein